MKPTNLRAELLKRRQRKLNELSSMYGHQEEIAAQIRAAEAVLDEIDSLLKLLPEEDAGQSETKPEPELRPNSAMAKARDALRKLRKPTHIDKLIEAMEFPLEKKRSITGQLSWYARRDQIFTRPEPNTFGLREWAPKIRTVTVMENVPESDPLALSLEDVPAANSNEIESAA